MIEKGKISPVQMSLMMNPTISATAVLLVPAITAQHAKQDLWLSPIWAAPIGFLAIFIAYRLNKIYPNESIIEYSGHIIGKIPGKMIGLLFLLFYLHVGGIVIQEYGQFVVGTFLQRTPIHVVMISMILVSAFAVNGGIEVIARTSQIILPVVFLFYLLIIIMLLPDIDVQQIAPFMGQGITPSIKGAAVPSGWFSEFMLITFLLPFISDKKKGMKWGMISVASVMIILSLMNLITYMIFGPLTETFTYPVINAVRYISIADFLEHVESVVMAIWVAGTFIKITIFYYAVTIGTAQWLKLSDYRPIVLPIGFLMVVFGLWSAPNLSKLQSFLGTISPFYFTTVQIVVPILLLSIALLRKKLKRKKGAAT
mgnify:CR=1 FL=1